jgi:hypothetical protein
MTNAYYGSITTGSSVTIAGVAVAGYNGPFTVTGTPSATQFTYTAASGLAASGAGTVTSADVNALAKSRLNAFMANGGGYIATNTSTSGFSFLTGATPSAFVAGSLTQGSQSAYGGIAQWVNAGAASPISGPYPATDTMFLPANTTYFSAIPSSNVTVDAQYPSNIATIGPANGFISGMWLNRDAAANNAAVLIHGATTVGGRYVAYANNPFSRYDAEREWPLIVQSALWSDVTDEGQITFAISAADTTNGSISPSGDKMVAVGNDQAYTIKPDTGYHIADVLVDGSSVGAVTSYTFQNVAADHTISATFAINQYAITASAGAHGTIAPPGTTTVDYGNSQTYTITPATGYSVDDVLVDGTSVGAVTSYTFTNVAAAHTISATFAVNPIPWRVTLKLSKSSVKSGTKVKFSGSVTSTSSLGTGTARIQRKKSHGSWGNWKTVKLNSKGKYSVTIKMSKKGTWYFRTMKASDSSHLTSYSSVRKLKVH